MWVSDQLHTLTALTHGERSGIHFTGGCGGGGQSRCGRVRKISPPPGFDPRTIEPVASRYTD
jgi:hypothetical protein